MHLTGNDTKLQKILHFALCALHTSKTNSDTKFGNIMDLAARHTLKPMLVYNVNCRKINIQH